jgi:RNA polymerase sigma factor (sigma-70 family)
VAETPALETDAEIALRVRSGSADGLERMIDRFGPEIHAVAYSICRDQAMAEDVAAVTIATAWRRIDSLRDPTRLRRWLVQITTRQALGQLRRSRSIRLIPQLPHAVAPGIESTIVDRVDLSRALESLPPRMRAIVALRYVADLSLEEISAATGRSKNTVKSELRVGLQRLRATWSGRQDES